MMKNNILWEQQMVENYQFWIPKDYDEILCQWYGDYMQLSPEKDRIYHHLYKVYKK